MEEPRNASDPVIALPGAGWTDWRWLVLLIVCSSALRIWQVSHTHIASRDSIGFIRQAWQLQHESFPQAIRQGLHHPGYPVAIALVAIPVQKLMPDDLPRSMELTAQLVSSLASVLLVVPMFYLGRGLFDSRVGFWGTLLFQVLPPTGKLMADGLSEPLFLLFATIALFAALRGLQSGGLGWFILCGLATGLSYWTRTEGLLLGLATAVVLLWSQTRPRWRRPWRQTSLAALGLAGACAVLAIPFMLLIGGVSLKASMKNLQDPGSGDNQVPADKDPFAHAVDLSFPLAAFNFRADGTQENAYVFAARALLLRINGVFFYGFTPFWLAGVWLFWRRGQDVPGMWVLTVLCLCLLPLLFRLAQASSYLSERHAILIALGGVYFVVAALGVLGARLMRLLPGRLAPHTPLALVLLMIVPCLPKALSATRASQIAHRQAGEWLARHSQPGDPVKDPQSWASYYAGRVFVEGQSDVPRSDPPVCYVVLERSSNPRHHLAFLTIPAEKLASKGALVHQVSIGSSSKPGEINIYKVVRPVSSAKR